MLARSQLGRQLPLLRRAAFSTTATQHTAKVPSLGDITHTTESIETFNRKLKDYREKRAAAEKAAVKSAVDAKNLSQPGNAGIVNSILYGSEKGKREEAEMEQSYSTVLARGKYVHAIEIHQVKPDQHEAYVKLCGETFPIIAEEKTNNCHLVGSWKSEIGDLDTFVHVWEYQGYAGYHETIHQLSQSSSVYQNYKKNVPRLLTSRRTDLMQEFSFWPTAPPRSLGGVFELRSYTLHPGNLLEWEQHWRSGLKARRNVMEGVGAWFTQVGALNTVHYLWQFADLRARQVAREKSWAEKGWSTTVHKTVPLIQRMESRIMVALPWSPVS